MRRNQGGRFDHVAYARRTRSNLQRIKETTNVGRRHKDGNKEEEGKKGPHPYLFNWLTRANMSSEVWMDFELIS